MKNLKEINGIGKNGQKERSNEERDWKVRDQTKRVYWKFFF